MTLNYSSEIETNLAHKIHKSLHEIYRRTASPVKRISQLTDIPVETIKNWYKGQNLPKAGHLIILARAYPEVMITILEQTGYEYLVPFMIPIPQTQKSKKISKKSGKNVPINVPIKFQNAQLNHRQCWFLVRLQEGAKISVHDICDHWAVSIKSAKRDIADMKRRGLIEFQGPKKTGFYKTNELNNFQEFSKTEDNLS